MKILLVLDLSLLVGSEREEHKASTEQKTFGGVRTYPLIGLIGYAMALLGAGQLLPLTLGFAVVGGLSVSLLLAQAHLFGSRRYHLRGFRLDHLPSRRARLPGTFLDCHYAECGQRLATRVEDHSSGPHQAHLSGRDFLLHQVSRSHCRRSPGCA